MLLLYIIPMQINDVSEVAIGPRFFPTALVYLIIVMSVISLLLSFIRSRKVIRSKEDKLDEEQQLERAFAKSKGYKQVAITLLALIAWTILMPYIGFVVTTFLLMISLMFLIGTSNLMKMLVISSLFTILLYAVANYLFHLAIQSGIIF